MLNLNSLALTLFNQYSASSLVYGQGTLLNVSETLKSPIKSINRFLLAFPNFFKVSEEKLSYIVKQSLTKADEPNSLHYFTSKINKEFNYNKKVQLLEILWEIVLADGNIHDFESNLIRRLSGLLYVSDIDCGNAKKRSLIKTEED